MLTEQDHRDRATGLGGSDQAGYLGICPFDKLDGPVFVFRNKTEGFRKAETAEMRRGTMLEPEICAQFALETGYILHNPKRSYVHPEWPDVRIRGNPDRFIVGRKREHLTPDQEQWGSIWQDDGKWLEFDREWWGILEAKSTRAFGQIWAAYRAGRQPVSHTLQTHVYAMCANTKWGISTCVSVTGPDELKTLDDGTVVGPTINEQIHIIWQRSKPLCKALADEAQAWWRAYIEPFPSCPPKQQWVGAPRILWLADKVRQERWMPYRIERPIRHDEQQEEDEMGKFEIRKAQRRALSAKVALVGPAGSGKTYSALLLAQGLAGEDGTIAVIDTEHGRSELYADLCDFSVITLEDYSPVTYAEAIDFAVEQGFSVIIIDSLSHAWDGAGGALELVDAARNRNKNNKFAGWKDVTPLHRRMMDKIVKCPVHLVATMRSKTKYEVQMTDSGKTKPVRIGQAPVQREGSEYEFDLFCQLDQDHVMDVQKTRLVGLNLDNKQIMATPELGRDIQAWLGEGVEDPERVRQQKQASRTEALNALGAYVKALDLPEIVTSRLRAAILASANAKTWPDMSEEDYRDALATITPMDTQRLVEWVAWQLSEADLGPWDWANRRLHAVWGELVKGGAVNEADLGTMHSFVRHESKVAHDADFSDTSTQVLLMVADMLEAMPVDDIHALVTGEWLDKHIPI